MLPSLRSGRTTPALGLKNLTFDPYYVIYYYSSIGEIKKNFKKIGTEFLQFKENSKKCLKIILELRKNLKKNYKKIFELE